MRLHLLLLAAALSFAPPARALTVTVPAQYPTLGAAIASGADVVEVSQGTYAEDVTIPRSLELVAAPSASPSGWPAFPTLDGSLTLGGGGGGSRRIVVSGFRVTGAVSIATVFGDRVLLEVCRLEGGVASGAALTGVLGLRGCTVLGDIVANSESIELTASTLLGAGLRANYEADGTVRWNHVAGPAAAGIELVGNDGGGSIFENVVTGTTDGIVVTDGSGMEVTDNEVRQVTGHAYVLRQGTTGPMIPSASFRRNDADSPGLDAFHVTGSAWIEANTVRDPGGNGIHAGSEGGVVTMLAANQNSIDGAGLDGIRLEGDVAFAPECSHNTVVRCQGPGIRLAAAGTVEFNVTGRNGGVGIALLAPFGTTTWSHNTSYLNGGDGYALAGDAATQVTNNIGHGNQGFGMRWAGAGTPARGCNDWFGNLAGAVTGTTPGATDLFVNPAFCDLPHDVVDLSASSPLVGTACGQIGAKGIGCSDPVGVPPQAPGPLGFAAGPRPAAGDVSFTWRMLTQPGLLEVFDAAGSRVWHRRLAAGESAAVWRPGRSGKPAAPGVYFARLRCGNRTGQQRVVLRP